MAATRAGSGAVGASSRARASGASHAVASVITRGSSARRRAR
jgi:hypothetical protein